MSSYFVEGKGGVGTGGDDWVLILFIAGRSPNSQRAQQILLEIVAQHLPGRCNVQIVDILEDVGPAIDREVRVVPTLLRLSPLPEVRITGSLRDRQGVLEALGLVEA